MRSKIQRNEGRGAISWRGCSDPARRAVHARIACQLAAAIVLALAAMPATAAEYTKPGWFLGGGIGYAADTAFASAVEEGLVDLGAVAAQVKVDGSLAANLRVGKRFSQFFTMELQGEYLPKLKTSVSPSPTAPFTRAADLWKATVTANLKMSIFARRWQPFLLVGGGFLVSGVDNLFSTQLLETEIGGAIRMGVGFDFYLTKRLSIAPEVSYVLPFGKVEKRDYLTLGGSLYLRF